MTEQHSVTVRVNADYSVTPSFPYVFDMGAGPRAVDIPADGQIHAVEVHDTGRGFVAYVDGTRAPIRRPS